MGVNVRQMYILMLRMYRFGGHFCPNSGASSSLFTCILSSKSVCYFPVVNVLALGDNFACQGSLYDISQGLVSKMSNSIPFICAVQKHLRDILF